MTNLTREEIAEILAKSRDEWQREYFKKYPVSEGTCGPLDMAAFHLTQADALLARLRAACRPANHPDDCDPGTAFAELVQERDALHADVARLERQVNASVTTENYKALVLKLGDVNADLRACAEALTKYGTHLEGCGRLAYDTWTPRKPKELNCTCGLFDAALARPGVQREGKT